eukprot:5597118-Amphidinium_carterae.1
MNKTRSQANSKTKHILKALQTAFSKTSLRCGLRRHGLPQTYGDATSVNTMIHTTSNSHGNNTSFHKAPQRGLSIVRQSLLRERSESIDSTDRTPSRCLNGRKAMQ